MHMLSCIKEFLFRTKKQKIVSIIVTACYFLLHLYVVLNHECWRDESQAWLIAKNLSYIDIFKELCVEGHPCLWFMIIAPFAKLGLSFYYFNFISLALCTMAVYLLMEKGPFCIFTKMAIVSSSMFLYFNPVVCRIYSLIVILVVFILMIYEDRLIHPILYILLVSLLMQTHIMIYGLAFGLAIEYCFSFYNTNNTKKLKAFVFVLPILSTLLLFFELTPRVDYPAYTDVSINTIIQNINFGRIIHKLENLGYVSWGWNNNLSVFVPLGIFTFLGIIQILLIRKSSSIKKYISELTISFFGINYYLSLYIFVYSSHSQLASVLMIIVVASTWIICSKEDKISKIPTTLFIIIASMLTFIPAQSILRSDISGNYSNSKNVAAYIEKNIENNSIIALEDGEGYNTPIIAYVTSKRNDIKFYSLTLDKYYTYNSWIYLNNYKPFKIEEIIDKSLKINNNGNIYYLSNDKKKEKTNFSLVFESYGSFTNEDYYLYKITY